MKENNFIQVAAVVLSSVQHIYISFDHRYVKQLAHRQYDPIRTYPTEKQQTEVKHNEACPPIGTQRRGFIGNFPY